jgi:hypothetical protein
MRTGSFLNESAQGDPAVKLPLAVGAKAGACVGFVWGLAEAAIGFFSFPYWISVNSWINNFLFLYAIAGAFFLALLGALLVRYQHRIPGDSMSVKGVMLMLFLWGATRLYSFSIGIPVVTIVMILTSISYTAAGAALGSLINRFSKD